MLGLFAYQQHHKTGTRALALLLWAVTAYTFGYAFELASTTLSGILFWLKVEYLGISLFPAFLVIMITQYTGKDRWLSPPVLMALYLISIMTLFLHYTNNYHHLYYHTVGVSSLGPFPLATLKKGPWYWVHTVYLNLALLYGSILLLGRWQRVAPLYRRQIIILLAGAVVPWIGGLLYFFGKSPWGLDLSPIALSCTALILTWGLCRYRLFNLAPVARDMVFESMRNGVLVLDTENRLVDFNPAAQTIVKKLSLDNIGLPAAKILQAYPDLIKQLALNNYKEIDFRTFQGKKPQYYNSRLSPVLNRRKQLIGKTIVLTNITRQTLLYQRLKKLATTDYLTNIFNRGHFLELSKKEIYQANRYQRPISIILMDLDYFKQINDRFGHKAGDITLKTLAETCSHNLRTPDLFGRFGGEEFAILLPKTTPAAALEVAERLRKKIAAIAVPFEQTTITITASLGVAGVDIACNITLEALLKKADRALYQAKETGRNSVVLDCTPQQGTGPGKPE